MGFICESFATEVFAIFMIIAVYVYIDFKRSFTYWKRKDVPYLPPSFPLGNLDYDFWNCGMLVYHKYNDAKQLRVKYIGVYAFKCPFFISIHPDINKWILVQNFDNFPDHGVYYDEKNDPMTASIPSVRGEKWHHLRSLFNPAFTPSKMKAMTPSILSCSTGIQQILETAVRTSSPVDVHDIAARYTTDAIGSCAFGIDCNSLENPEAEFRKHALLIIDDGVICSLRIIFSVIAPNLLRLFKIACVNPKASKFFCDAFRNTVQFRDQYGIEKNDLIGLLIRQRNSKSLDNQCDNANTASSKFAEQMTTNDVAIQAVFFFLAGYDTSANTIAFCLYELAVNLHVQEKLRCEIHDVLSKYNGEITYDAIMEMSYLDKVVNETLRKYPTVVMLNRRCEKACQVPESDVTIEKDTHIVISIFGLHYDPEYYPDPDIFDPERFCEEEMKKRPKYTYLPFGAGPRACIGIRFGLLESKIGIVTFLNKYKYTLNPETVTPVHLTTKSIILRAQTKMWLDVQKI